MSNTETTDPTDLNEVTTTQESDDTSHTTAGYESVNVATPCNEGVPSSSIYDEI